jgi:S-adenosylmethionine uptake transporter
MVQLTDNMRGAVMMAGSMTAFTCNDAFMKAISDELPLFQAIFLRGTFVIVMLVILCKYMGQLRFDFGRQNWRLVGIRTLAEMASTVCFISALYHLPIGNVSAILQALPLTVTLGAALVFREALGWRRMTAILVGFVGVMLIIRPGGADFNLYSLYAVGAVLGVTVRDLAARRMTAALPSTMVGLIAAVGVTAMAAIGVQFEEWQIVSPTAVAQLGGAGVFIIGGYVFSVAAMRAGEIGFVAPFRYTSLLVALILGYFVFGDFPKPLTLLGAGIVVAMGLFTLYREHQLQIRRRRGA